MGTSQIRSDLDLIGADGRCWMQLVGWEDKRFDVPERFHRFWVAPRETSLGQSWQGPLARVPAAASVEGHRLEPFLENGNAIWKDLWASLVLTRRERHSYRRNRTPNEWLLGRAAAKEAVRSFLKKQKGLDLLPADIEIDSDEKGRPVPAGPWARGMASLPALSVSAIDDVAVAVAGDPPSGLGLGIELERVGRMTAELEAKAFGPEERQLLASLPASASVEWALRSWCAKRAVAKALAGKTADPISQIRLRELDALTGVAKLTLEGELAAASPQLAGVPIVAYTSREGEYVYAGTACEAGSL
jgi:phosphopantetheinyl transferase